MVCVSSILTIVDTKSQDTYGKFSLFGAVALQDRLLLCQSMTEHVVAVNPKHHTPTGGAGDFSVRKKRQRQAVFHYSCHIIKTIQTKEQPICVSCSNLLLKFTNM